MSERNAVDSIKLLTLADKWEQLSQSWKKVAEDILDDAPDVASKAQARVAIYFDCAEELRVIAKKQEREE